MRATTLPAAAPRATPFSGNWLAVQGRLPLAFMGLGLAWLAAGALLLVLRPEALALPHLHPHVVALTHVWVLGFFVTVACGAVYQLAPVALGTVLRNERHAWWHFWLHALGLPGLVIAFWRWDMGLVGHFGGLVGLGLTLFAVNTWRTVRQSGRRGTVAWSLVIAAAWLLVTVVLGLLLSVNRYWAFLPLDPLALLRAHAHLGLVGFFLALLQGVGFQLIPMFTLGEVRDWRLANAGLWLAQGGLLALAPGLAGSVAPLALGGALAIVAGMGCSAVGLRRTLATRKKRALDPGVAAFLRGGAGVLLAALAGLALLVPGTTWGSAAGGHNGMTYAVLLVAGGLLPCFSGMLCKVVPFLTWMRAYGPKIGRVPTPPASALTRPALERVGLGLQQAATLPLLVGAWTLQLAWLQAGVWILAAGTALFLTDMLGVLRHLWADPVPTAPPGNLQRA